MMILTYLAVPDQTVDQINATAKMMEAINDHGMNPAVAVFVFLAIAAVALFTFLSVAAWVASRQAERKAFYNAEMMKKIAEIGGEHNQALDYLREQERIAAAKRLGGIKLGGLINIAVGLGLVPVLGWLLPRSAAAGIGLIPLFIGVAMLVYAFWLAPRPEA